jgi:plastocyanin
MTRPSRRATGVSVAALALVLGAILTACSGPSSAAGAPVATSTVDLPPSYRFAPADISVAAGTTVTWTNDDHFTHSVHFLDGGLPSAPMVMQPGDHATFTFTTPGRYAYECHLHPQDMRGTVTVGG